MDFPPTDWEAVFAFNPAILQSPRRPVNMLQAYPAGNAPVRAHSTLVNDLTTRVTTEATPGRQDSGLIAELGVCSSCRQYVNPECALVL